MKKFKLAWIAWLLILSLSAQAQNRIDLSTIDVKDSSGTIYPTYLVKKLLESGKYTLQFSQDRKTAWLVELSAEESEKMTKMITEKMNNPSKPKESPYFKTGSTIASFKENDINGNSVNLKEMAGKVVVLNFWFINCPPCRQEMPHLNEVVEKYKYDKDVVFIAVARDSKYELQEFLKTSPFKYNIINDGSWIADKYSIRGYPTHVVLDKQGKVLFHTSGYGPGTVEWIGKSIEAGLNETAKH
jgi:thiol-disulfide isomerase/thioredoxin